MPKKKKSDSRAPGLKSATWNTDLIQQFIETLMDLTLCSDVRELKNHIIPECIWKELEKKLKIDWKSLSAFWNHRLHIQLFSPDPIYLNDVKVKLIEYCYGKGVVSFQDIQWGNVTSCFDGYTSEFLRRTFINLNRDAKIKTGSSDLGENMGYMYTRLMRRIKDRSDDLMLPRFKYSDGQLQHEQMDLEYIASNAGITKSELLEADVNGTYSEK